MNGFQNPYRRSILLGIGLLVGIATHAQSDGIHTVTRGQTLFSIARQYNVDVENLRSLNNLPNSTIEVGQTLRIGPIASSTATQNVASGEKPVMVQTRREIQKMEQDLDRYVDTVLSSYFERSTYFVNTTIVVRSVDQQMSQLSGTTETRRPLNLTLPGLPAIPDYLRSEASKEPTMTQQSSTLTVPDIGQIQMVILTDSSYSEDHLALMRLIASSAAKLDIANGDRITVVRRNLPQPLAEQPSIDTPEPVLATKPPLENSETGLGNRSYWAWLAVGLAVLLIGLAAFLIRRKNVSAPIRNPELARDRIESNEPIASAVADSPIQRLKETIYTGRPETDTPPRDWLLWAFMRRTTDMARLLDDWIVTEGDDGLSRACQLVMVADEKFATLLEPTMNILSFRKLCDGIAAQKQFTGNMNILLDSVSDVIAGLRVRENPEALCFKIRTLRHMDFIDHADATTVGQALAHGHARLSAFVVGHLHPDQVDQIMAHVDDDKAHACWLELGRVSKMTRGEYVALAEEWFETITRLEVSGEADIDPIESFVEEMRQLVERQPVVSQTRLHKRFMADPSPSSQAVANRLITYANLTSFDSNPIREVADSLEIPTLAQVLSGLDADYMEELLENRSARERDLFRYHLTQQNPTDTAGQEHAKRSFMDQIRGVLRKTNPVMGMVIALLLAGCGGTRAMELPDDLDVRPMPTTETTVLTGDGVVVASPLLEKETFDRLHAEYQERYNRMIDEHFQAQRYLSNGELERARAAALRAIAILPMVQTYDVLLMAATSTALESDRKTWMAERDKLRATGGQRP